jgi:hypothetical protein
MTGSSDSGSLRWLGWLPDVISLAADPGKTGDDTTNLELVTAAPSSSVKKGFFVVALLGSSLALNFSNRDRTDFTADPESESAHIRSPTAPMTSVWWSVKRAKIIVSITSYVASAVTRASKCNSDLSGWGKSGQADSLFEFEVAQNALRASALTNCTGKFRSLCVVLGDTTRNHRKLKLILILSLASL